MDCSFQSSFGIHVDILSVAKGGFFLMKEPLECVLSVYSISETAIAEKRTVKLRIENQG